MIDGFSVGKARSAYDISVNTVQLRPFPPSSCITWERTFFRLDSAHMAINIQRTWPASMERFRSLPGRWEPGDLIRVRSKTITPESEGYIYDV